MKITIDGVEICVYPTGAVSFEGGTLLDESAMRAFAAVLRDAANEMKALALLDRIEGRFRR